MPTIYFHVLIGFSNRYGYEWYEKRTAVVPVTTAFLSLSLSAKTSNTYKSTKKTTNQLYYSSDEETEDIAEDKSDDKLQQQKELWNGEKVCNHDIIYIYI